jgi:putative phosphoribosyl transferase
LSPYASARFWMRLRPSSFPYQRPSRDPQMGGCAHPLGTLPEHGSCDLLPHMSLRAPARMKAMTRVFLDRAEAGRELAVVLRDHVTLLGAPTYVLAVPRGGVPVAYEIATSLDLPLDVMLVTPVLMAEELSLLARRGRTLRGTRPPPDLAGHTILLVADEFADAGQLCRMVDQLRLDGARRVVLVAPVASAAALEAARACADGMVCLSVEATLQDCPRRYRDARPVVNHEVRRLLERAARRPVTQLVTP